MRRSAAAIILVAALAFSGAARVSASPRPATAPTPTGLPVSAPSPPVPTPNLPLPTPSSSKSPGPSKKPPVTSTAHCPKKSGTTITFCFDTEKDRASWYWVDQKREVVNVGPVAQPLNIPDPQASDTLPDAVKDGTLNKVSALYLDVEQHGVPDGATITKFVLTIEEGQTPQGPEQPEYNTDKKVVAACPASEIWASGQAELWKDRPSYSAKSCVKGVRRTKKVPKSSGSLATWTFDLSKIARKWAINPFVSNNGIVLVPYKLSTAPKDRQWQVNLKIPSRDDTKTPAVNEYDETKGRVVASVTYKKPTSSKAGGPTSNPTTVTSSPPPITTGTSGSTCCTTSGSGGGGSFSSGSGGSFGGGAPAVSGGSGGSASTTTGGSKTQPVAQASPPAIPTVKLPWYVWVLLPIGLLAVAAVRSILFEQAHGGIRPDGVIAAIRNRNAAARGAGAGAHTLASRIRSVKEGLKRPGNSG